jgi:hypothetical protein
MYSDGVFGDTRAKDWIPTRRGVIMSVGGTPHFNYRRHTLTPGLWIVPSESPASEAERFQFILCAVSGAVSGAERFQFILERKVSGTEKRLSGVNMPGIDP